MPKFEPFDTGFPIKASVSNLVAFRWETTGITADFELPGDATRVLRVTFDRECIVRILDEMPLSTEDDETPNEGLVSEHFAYRLEGARFADAQSEAWKRVNGSVRHYRFITGWACMDVLSGGTPTFSIEDRIISHAVSRGRA